jgi:hypothetical protein
MPAAARSSSIASTSIAEAPAVIVTSARPAGTRHAARACAPAVHARGLAARHRTLNTRPGEAITPSDEISHTKRRLRAPIIVQRQ